MGIFTTYIKKSTSKRNSIAIIVLFILSILIMENEWFGQTYMKNTFGVGMIDMKADSTTSEITDYLGHLGESGRSSYNLLLQLDFIVIISIALLQINLFAKLLKSINVANLTKYFWMFIIPLLRAGFDVAENLTMFYNSSLFPITSNLMVHLSVVFKSLKWAFMACSIAILIVLLVIYLVRFVAFKWQIFSAHRN